MADDLDDLLDEVESKFCCSPSSKLTHYDFKQTDRRNATSENTITSTRDFNRNRHEDDDFDDVLREILEDDIQPTGRNKIAARTLTSESQSVSMRCCPVFVGGTQTQHGIGTTISHRTCSQLRCTSCDFCVVMFDDQEWDSSCDYLFFRNNMPDFHKLKAKLRRNKGVRAYGCQCSWFSARTLSDLREHQQLKWVCGKHEV